MYENTIPDKQLQIFFEDPQKCTNGGAGFRKHLPLRDERVEIQDYAESIDTRVIYFEHELSAGVIFAVMAIIVIVIALYWAVGKGDISGGFTILAGVVALVTLGVKLCFRR